MGQMRGGEWWEKNVFVLAFSAREVCVCVSYAVKVENKVKYMYKCVHKLHSIHWRFFIHGFIHITVDRVTYTWS